MASSAQRGRSEVRERPSLVRATLREQKRLGAKLSALRRARALSQESAAERIGVSTKQVGRLERGEANVTLATLVACASTYRVELTDLFA